MTSFPGSDLKREGVGIKFGKLASRIRIPVNFVLQCFHDSFFTELWWIWSSPGLGAVMLFYVCGLLQLHLYDIFQRQALSKPSTRMKRKSCLMDTELDIFHRKGSQTLLKQIVIGKDVAWNLKVKINW